MANGGIDSNPSKTILAVPESSRAMMSELSVGTILSWGQPGQEIYKNYGIKILSSFNRGNDFIVSVHDRSPHNRHKP